MGVGVTMVGGRDGKDGGLRAMAIPSPATTRGGGVMSEGYCNRESSLERFRQ
jgi:hypothetical protein